MTVIGLGEAGCNLAELFEGSEHNVKLFDVDIEGDNCFSIEKQNNPEKYEQNFPDVSNFLSDCSDHVLFFVGGGGNISGATLRLLNYVKDKTIYIVYIRPDNEILGTTAEMQDRLVFNVLQEYTRSGLFKGMVLFSNKEIEEVCGNLPIRSYYEVLNKTIYNAMITLFNSTSQISVYDNYSPPKDIACISTYGVYNLKNDEEKLFYELQNLEDKCYYFFINKNRLETDGNLFKEIKNSMKKKVVDNVKISYIIHSTDREEDFCYVTACSSKIQQ